MLCRGVLLGVEVATPGTLFWLSLCFMHDPCCRSLPGSAG